MEEAHALKLIRHGFKSSVWHLAFGKKFYFSFYVYKQREIISNLMAY